MQHQATRTAPLMQWRSGEHKREHACIISSPGDRFTFFPLKEILYRLGNIAQSSGFQIWFKFHGVKFYMRWKEWECGGSKFEYTK